MAMCTRFFICVTALGVLGNVAQGDVVAMNIVLTEQADAHPSSYTVPAGKVLVVEHVFAASSGTSVGYYITVGGLLLRVSISSGAGTVSWSPSLKLTAGLTINAQDGSQGGVGIIYALLVDESDLYAAITSEFESVSAASGDVRGTLRLGSPRPSLVKIERTGGLEADAWTEELSALIQRTSSLNREYVLPLPGENRQFYRATARARKSSGASAAPAFTSPIR